MALLTALWVHVSLRRIIDTQKVQKRRNHCPARGTLTHGAIRNTQQAPSIEARNDQDENGGAMHCSVYGSISLEKGGAARPGRAPPKDRNTPNTATPGTFSILENSPENHGKSRTEFSDYRTDKGNSLCTAIICPTPVVLSAIPRAEAQLDVGKAGPLWDGNVHW